MEGKQLFIRITKIASIVLLISGIVVHLITHDYHYTLGVVVGGLMSVGGFWWIVAMTNNLQEKAHVNGMVFANYLIRYLIYAVIMVIGILQGLDIFSMLVGFLCINLAIKIDTFIAGKEED